VTLARAGCGSGKTTAAYLWASQRGDRKKLFFCYPTTGTATEGFADYVLPGSIEGRLIHGRAEVDLERLLTSDGGLDPQDCQPAFEALSTWDVPLAVCTADTVLGLIQNNRRGLCSVPAIGQGAFVFDEVHAYDEQMFGALLRFLRVFTGAPVLLMTASLPVERRRALVEAVGAGRLLEVFGPRELEDLPRYQIRQVNPEQALSTSLEEMSTGSSSTSTRKVLWVSNTVGRCVERGRALEAMGSAVLPYHSRYRYSDRVDRHRQVVDSFKTDEPALAVTTQVCEMSLDLSASLLVTDLAPVSALIQRLGRLNRRATSEEPGQPRRCLVLEPEFVQPYTRAELDQAQAWLEALGEGDLSQADLTREFEALGTPLSDRSVRSAWLDGGPAARLEPLRDAGLTAPFIRGEDRKQAELGREERIRLEVPMTIRPVEKEIRSWSRVGPSWVAPPGRITYCPKWGAEWKL
jgi:CRISPR-associated endonuclease/helicase Cas3